MVKYEIEIPNMKRKVCCLGENEISSFMVVWYRLQIEAKLSIDSRLFHFPMLAMYRGQIRSFSS